MSSRYLFLAHIDFNTLKFIIRLPKRNVLLLYFA